MGKSVLSSEMRACAVECWDSPGPQQLKPFRTGLHFPSAENDGLNWGPQPLKVPRVQGRAGTFA